MHQYDNPARRLHDILTEAIEASEEIGPPSKVATKAVWNAVFGEGDDSHIISSIDEIHGLIYLTRNCINRLQVSNRVSHLKGLEQVSKAVHSTNLLSGTWGDMHTRLNQPMVLDFLAVIADAIDSNGQVLALAEGQQLDLLNSAQSLLDEVASSAIDRDLKIFLSIRLEEVCSALRHYSFSGSEGLRIVVESSIGGTALRSYNFDERQSGQSLLGKFLKLLLKCGTLLGITANVDGFLLPEVTELAEKLLPPGE